MRESCRKQEMLWRKGRHALPGLSSPVWHGMLLECSAATISSFILQNLIILNTCLCLAWSSHRDKALVIVLGLQASGKGGRNFSIETGLSWRIIPPLLRLTSLCKFTDAKWRDQVNTHLSCIVITSRVSLDRHFWSWSVSLKAEQCTMHATKSFKKAW